MSMPPAGPAVTVLCVWVRGNVPYSVDYVGNLRKAVRRHLSIEHEFICLTDRPKMLPPGVKAFPIPTPSGMFGWWAKVRLFDPELAKVARGDRMFYIDLDSLVTGKLDDIPNFDAPFALVPHAGDFQGKDGLTVVKRFNSSVMVWNRGGASLDQLWRQWEPAITHRLWGDQDWIGEQVPSAATMPAEWFPRLSSLKGAEPDDDARIVLAKKPKPHIAAHEIPWARKAWQG